MTSEMSHDRFLHLLAYIQMFIYSLFQHALCFAHIHSFVTFAANEGIDNIPIAATWILSCLVFGVSCRTPYFLPVHSIAYPKGACAVFLFHALLVLSWTRVSARFLSRLYATIGGFWNTSVILSDLCNTGRCFQTILWMSGRCLEKVSTKSTLSSFFSLLFTLRRSSLLRVSTLCSCSSMFFPLYPLL